VKLLLSITVTYARFVTLAFLSSILQIPVFSTPCAPLHCHIIYHYLQTRFLLVKIGNNTLVDIATIQESDSLPLNMHTTTTSLALLAAIFTLINKTTAHSWIEQMQGISDNGSFIGNMGYARGYMARTDPGYNGDTMTYLLPALDTGRTRINSSDLLCHPAQRTSNYTSDYPMLQVSPGGYVSIKYLENGHVTLPQNQPGKPKAAGTVFVYGTTQPGTDEKMVDVLAWSADGKGGDGRGSLLTAQNFDDARCHQINSGAISTQRQQQFPDRVPNQPTSNVEQWCETDLIIPASAAPNSKFTLYWIWQWPTAPGVDPTYPDGKDEYYTTCADVEIVVEAVSAGVKPTSTLLQQDPQSTACSDFKSRTALTTSPIIITASATGVYAAAAAAATSAADSNPAPSSSQQAETTSITITVTASAPTAFVTIISTVSGSPTATSSTISTISSTSVPPSTLPSAAAQTPDAVSSGLTLPYVTLPSATPTIGAPQGEIGNDGQSRPAALSVGGDGLIAEKRRRSVGVRSGRYRL